MQRKDFIATRTSRIDRFAQMSKVEQVIEQKKREIQARMQLEKKSSTEKEIVEKEEPAEPPAPGTDEIPE